jgi:hypothetical protein
MPHAAHQLSPTGSECSRRPRIALHSLARRILELSDEIAELELDELVAIPAEELAQRSLE